MRTFFYSIKTSDCESNCQWHICPQRYLAKLKAINGLKDIHPIYGDVFPVSLPLDSTPKNGDVIILYAKDALDVDFMITARDDFDGLKKILVMGDSAGVDGVRYHRLAPRFITQVDRNILELEAVIQKMNGHVHSF